MVVGSRFATSLRETLVYGNAEAVTAHLLCQDHLDNVDAAHTGDAAAGRREDTGPAAIDVNLEQKFLGKAFAQGCPRILYGPRPRRRGRSS